MGRSQLCGIEQTTTESAAQRRRTDHRRSRQHSHSATAIGGAFLVWLIVEKVMKRPLLGRASRSASSRTSCSISRHTRAISRGGRHGWPALGLGLYEHSPMSGFAVEMVRRSLRLVSLSSTCSTRDLSAAGSLSTPAAPSSGSGRTSPSARAECCRSSSRCVHCGVCDARVVIEQLTRRGSATRRLVGASSLLVLVKHLRDRANRRSSLEDRRPNGIRPDGERGHRHVAGH